MRCCWDVRESTWPLINHQSRDSIVSFNYFQNVIEEVGEPTMPPQYWRHLQMRVDRRESRGRQPGHRPRTDCGDGATERIRNRSIILR
jgi:hypothetical protein